jgi:hypothetical protein
MDTAVALVNAYLHINGYFTVTEYQVVESYHHGARTRTDIDVLAVRFPGAVHSLGDGRPASAQHVIQPDPQLDCAVDQTDMILGEVKQGPAKFNEGLWDPWVMKTALVRFGCCSMDEAEGVVASLLRRGRARTHRGHRARLIAFGASPDRRSGKFEIISLGHIYTFLTAYIRQHWDVIRVMDFKDPAFGLLVMLEKALKEYGNRQLQTTGT